MKQPQIFSPSRRKFPRKSFRKTISFLAAGQAAIAEGVEIGEGGISFKFHLKIPKEQSLIVNFFLPEGDFFSVRTTLKNIQNISNHYVYGVSFDDISIALKRQIRAYVARTSSFSAL